MFQLSTNRAILCSARPRGSFSLSQLYLDIQCMEKSIVENGLILFGTRLVIPKKNRREILSKLHTAHQGIERTKSRARHTVYWPSLNNDLTNLITSCEKCQQNKSSNQQETLKSEPSPSRPFKEVSADFFRYGGKDYLVYADKFSGWPVIFHFPGQINSKNLIKVCIKSFSTYGIPKIFKSDGGLQFSSREFKLFLEKWNVKLVQSTPYYPQSNGFAEAMVKSMKNLFVKCCNNGDIQSEEFMEAILEYRNTPKKGGLSPAKLLFGYNLRSSVPTHD